MLVAAAPLLSAYYTFCASMSSNTLPKGRFAGASPHRRGQPDPRPCRGGGHSNLRTYFFVILMLNAWVATCVAPSLTETVKL